MAISTSPFVPPSATEVEERIAEYRRLGWQRRAPAQVVYQDPHVVCPWPGCGYRIDGIHFGVEKWAEPDLREKLLNAWWMGPGLIGKCPGCQGMVLYGVLDKKTVDLNFHLTQAILPDDWSVLGAIVTKMLKLSLNGKSK